METTELKSTKQAVAGSANQYLTFSIANELYGVEILMVQEIITYSRITKVPNTPGFLKGIINLRGLVIPVVDLREQFGMATSDYDTKTVIIIMEVKGRVIGVVVDAVSDVATIPAQNIQPAPRFASRIRTDFILGMGKIDEQMVILIDINKIMGDEQIGILQDIS